MDQVVSVRRLIALVPLLALCLGACGGSAPKPVVTVTPASALWDRARTVVVSHLRPDEPVTVRARTFLPLGIWGSSATFRANRRGIVNLARQAPLHGSYHGVSPMGLWSSERQVRPRRGPYNGKATTAITAQTAGATASASMTQLVVGPGVATHMERVRSSGFFGIYYSPAPAVSHAPAVVLWGGSEGGDSFSEAAALLASHGIPALALAYFHDPGLPRSLERIPLEYFVNAIRWLRGQRQVDPRRVWLVSASRGTEAELLIAAHFPNLVHGVVASAPSSVVNGAPHVAGPHGGVPAWTLRGNPIGPGIAIPVHRITAAVILVAGGDDTVWPSFVMAPRIMASLPHNGAVHRYLYYPQAGHIVLGVPYGAVTNTVLNDGGTVASESAAWSADWPAMIGFITGR